MKYQISTSKLQRSSKFQHPIWCFDDWMFFGIWILVLGVLPCHGASVLIPLQTCGIAPAANRAMVLTPVQAQGANEIPVMDKIQTNTDQNGNALLSLLPGIYQCNVRPAWGQVGITEFYFYVDPSNAVQSAFTNLLTATNTTYPPNQFAYSAQASDARYAPVGVVANAANAVTNRQPLVNFGVFALGGSGPYTRGIMAQPGDNAQIVIDETIGERFYDSAGNRQLIITPGGVDGNFISPETNFDSRGWTNTSSSGVTANAFNGPLNGNVTGNSSMATNSISNPNGTTNGMYDLAYLPFITANNITDPSVQEDLSRLLGAIDASGHRTNLVDILLLNSRFKPTNNLSLFCNKFTFTSNSWTGWGANFNASAPANTISSTTGNATNTLFFTLPQPLTATNTIVITLRMNHPEYIDQGGSQAWCGYNQNLYGLYNTNTADEIWVNAAIQSGASSFQFVEKSNNVAYPISFSGGNPHFFSVPSISNHTTAGVSLGYEPYYYDTKTFCFTADGHGKRQVWVDGILSACGIAGNIFSYVSTNYPNTPLQVLVLGLDTNWTQGVIDQFSHAARAFVGEVESVQIYNCYADTNLVYASYVAAQYIPPGHRVDFFIGDSMFDQVVNGSGVGMTNRLSYVMSQQNQQNNWHDYSCTGQTLNNFLSNYSNLLTAISWMPTDKYTDIRIWTDIGANDQLNSGNTSAFSTYTNFVYAFTPYTAIPTVRIGFLGHPMVGLNFGASIYVENTNMMMWNNVMFQNGNAYNFSFPACNYIATNTMQNATYSADGAHMNGPSGWLLVKMMADGLENVGTVYDPVTNIIYNIP